MIKARGKFLSNPELVEFLLRVRKNSFLYLRISAALGVFLMALLRCQIAFRTGQYGVTTDLDFIESRKILGGLDAGSYMQGGLSFATGTYSDATNDFIWELWPPGMSIVNFFFIKTFGLDQSPLILWSVTSSLLLGFVTYLLIGSLRNLPRYLSVMGSGLICLFLLSSPTQGWLLDQGIMYAEGFTLLGLIGSLYFFRAYLDKQRPSQLFLSGLFLTLAIFMRSVNLAIVYLLATTLFFALLINALRMLKINAFSKTRFHLLGLFTILVVALSSMTIWMVFRWTWFQRNKFEWVSSAANAWKGYWFRNEDYTGTGWEIVAGIDNWACQVDELQCLEIHKNPDMNWDYQSLAIRSIIENPFSFASERFSNMWEYWILNGRWLYPPQSKIPASISLLEGCIFLLVLVFAVIYSAKIWSKRPELVALQIAVLLGNFLPLMVYHLEGRYFLHIKLVGVMILLQNLQTVHKFGISLKPWRLRAMEKPKT
jgi:hypothetical protein